MNQVHFISQKPARLIVSPEGDGAYNMAIDEVLLNSCTKEGHRPVIRLYGFKPYCLSVGRFQETGIVDFAALENDKIGFTRRPTGGMAVLHGSELTFSCVFSRYHLSPYSKRAVYRYMSGLLLKTLAAIGVKGLYQTENRGRRPEHDCFGSAGEYEIASSQHSKLIGAAQTVTRHGVLEHGSILLTDNINRQLSKYINIPENSKPVASISAELKRNADFDTIRHQFTQHLQRFVKAELDQLTDTEKEETQALTAHKYSNDEWNLKY